MSLAWKCQDIRNGLLGEECGLVDTTLCGETGAMHQHRLVLMDAASQFVDALAEYP